MAEERLTLAEAAELTGLTTRALARRIERGSLPATKNRNGRRTVAMHDLAAAGLIDPATGKPPAWTKLPPAGAVARELIAELTERGIRIADLERGHRQQGEQLDELRRELRRAERERAELRRQIKRLQQRP